jgi:hypothetical protein
MGRLTQLWAASLMMLFMSCIYYTYLVVQVGTMDPSVIHEEMIKSLGSYGIWAFVLDFLFIIVLGIFIKRRLKKKSLLKISGKSPMDSDHS